MTWIIPSRGKQSFVEVFFDLDLGILTNGWRDCLELNFDHHLSYFLQNE